MALEYREVMGRACLVLWLALFSLQTSDLIAAVAPDGCVEQSESSSDPCQEGCPRCVCCARLPPCVAQASADLDSEPAVPVVAPRSIELPPAAEPHGILHVPRPR
jgi:hypothetical protein